MASLPSEEWQSFTPLDRVKLVFWDACFSQQVDGLVVGNDNGTRLDGDTVRPRKTILELVPFCEHVPAKDTEHTYWSK